MIGDGIRSALTVTGAAAALAEDAALAAGRADYQRVRAERDRRRCMEQTTAFVAAVKAGDIAEAKALYPVARTYWERIEPVAESFGDLDPLIDGREGDEEPTAQDFTGFHRIEKELWADRRRQRHGRPFADQLLADVAADRRRVPTRSTLAPLQLANGAKALLDEVATGKITGEEDRYSHTDLWDFAGQPRGLAGGGRSRCARSSQKRDPTLVAEIDERFAATQAAARRLPRTATAGSSTPADQDQTCTRCRDAINALAEPVSKVAGGRRRPK